MRNSTSTLAMCDIDDELNSSDDEEFQDLQILQAIFDAEQSKVVYQVQDSLNSVADRQNSTVGLEALVNPEIESRRPSESDLSFLESNFILVDKFHWTFHCAKCFIVLSSNWAEHFRRNHRVKFSADLKAQIENLFLKSVSELDFTQGSQARKFEFLPVKPGFQCPLCYAIFLSKKRAQSHCKKAHIPAAEYNQVACQNLGYNGKPLYLCIQEDESSQSKVVGPDLRKLDSILSQMENVFVKPTAPESPNEMNIFYLKRSWYLEDDPFSEYDIVKIIRVPKEGDEDFEFYDHCTDIFIDVLRNMHKLDKELRRALRDPSDDEESSKGKFHLLTTPKSNKLYAKFFSSFLLAMRRMVLNPSKEVRIDVSIANLINSLRETPSKRQIFALLSAVIRENPNDCEDSTMIGILFIRFFCRKPIDSSLCQPAEITTFCSKFIYLIKLTVLNEVMELPDYRARQVYLAKNSKLATGAPFNLKRRIQFIRTDAFEAALGSKFHPAITIPDLLDPYRIIYNSIPLSSRNIQQAYSEALKRASEIQRIILHGCDPLIIYSQIQDKTICTVDGYCMTYGPSKSSNMKMKSSIIYHLERTNQLSAFGHEDLLGNFQWNCAIAKNLVKLYDQFIEMLILIIHLGSGMPARGTELATYTICNTRTSSRVAYFLGKRVYFLCLYNKTNNFFGTSRPIARFLDETASRIFLIDYFIIRPFIALLAKSLNQNENNIYMQKVFIYNGKRLDSEGISSLFTRNFGLLSGASIKFHEYRQIATYFGRQLCIVEENKKFSKARVTAGQISFSDQQGHSKSVELMHYGRSDQDHSSSSEQILASFMRLSIQWHDFVNQNILTNHDDAIYESQKMTNELMAKRFKRERNLNEDSILFTSTKMNIVKSFDSVLLLRELLGQNSTFRSKYQQQAVDHVLHKNEDLLCILPTGSGKSIIFFLKALQYKDKSIILIVPYLSLIQDIANRAQRLGFSTCTDHYQFNGEAILILTPEATISQAFRAFLVSQGNGGNISAIFLDEAHVFVTDVTYRHSLQKLEYLRIIAVPLICLTATCPFGVQNKIIEKLYNQITPTIIHESTDRFNLEYIVVREKNEILLMEAIRLFIPAAIQGEKMIIYFNSILTLEGFVETRARGRIEFAKYYATMGDAEKRRNFEAWKDGETNVMLATSAFGSGIDYPSVRQVIVFGLPYTIEEYSQMAGRGGRDGKITKCILMFNSQEESRRIAWQKSNGKVELANVLEKLLAYAIDQITCRRAYLSRYLDGMEVQCYYNPKSALCSNCKHVMENQSTMRGVLRVYQKNSIVLEKQAKLTRDKYNDENQFANELQYYLTKVSGRCTICIAKGDFDGSGHLTTSCRDLAHRCYICWDESHYSMSCRANLSLGSDICTHCYLPNELGGVTFHYGSWGQSCHQMQIKGFALGMFLYNRERLNIFESERDEFVKWLCMKNSGKVNNAADLFVTRIGVYLENALLTEDAHYE